jgi:GMP synthase-like glutamine amidotransferase
MIKTLHVLQHVDFEGPGNIAAWARDRGVDLHPVMRFAGAPLPRTAAHEGIVSLGGPMSVHDEAAHPWIRPEVEWLREQAALQRPILGICLGAQLLAVALGATVTRCSEREIGWFSVIPEEPSSNGSWLDPAVPVFHWHGEQFDLPPGSRRLASTEACPTQAFVRGRSLGIQFHLETTPGIAAALTRACADEIDDSPRVQSRNEILADASAYARLRQQLDRLLDEWFPTRP